MTQFFFDYYNQYEKPTITLCNPNKEELYALGNIHDTSLNLKYNALSEFKFTAPRVVNDQIMPYYDYLLYKRLVSVGNFGYFMITGVEQDNDGITDYKNITCQSLETEFVFKKISFFKGTYKFYDPISPASTLLGTLLTYAPDWSIGNIDATLWNIYRTFDISDTNIYALLMNDIEQAFQCVFTFDTITKKISAYSTQAATTNTDIFMSHDNLMEKISVQHVTEELVTALSVFGGGNLGIRPVNPLGTDTIYNFDYYKNTDWMSASLINAIDAWEANVVANQPTYANLLTSLMANNAILITQQSELAEIQSQLDADLEVQRARIQAGLSISAVNALIKAHRNEITAKNAQIAATQAVSDGIDAQLTVINTALSFDVNFTDAQQIELSNFIIGQTYQNENFIMTDIMSLVDIQQMEQALYDQAMVVLTKVSQPRYTFSVESVNFVFLKEFQTFINQLVLGAVITIEMRENLFVYPVLLEMDLSFDDPTQFKLSFGNRLRLDNSSFIFSDLFSETVQSGIDTKFNSIQWSNFDTNYRDQVSDFINNALDATKNAVINGDNQEMIMDQHGLRGRLIVDPVAKTYDPKQIWILNNVIAFTKDNWDTVSLALGEVQTPDHGTAYGLVADVIVGHLLAGNQLLITNENNSFILDGNGATLYNAKLTLTTNNLNNQIFLDPITGIAIQKRNPTTGSYANQFYVDANGNVIFAGNLQAASGTFYGAIYAQIGKIGMWTIDNWGLVGGGNYIYGDGRIRLGRLTINGDQAVFDGDIFARNLQDKVWSNQIGSLNADVINAGTIRGINIFGSTIYWGGSLSNPDVMMREVPNGPWNGYAEIMSKYGMQLHIGNYGPFIQINPQAIEINGGNQNAEIIIGKTNNSIIMAGDLVVYDNKTPKTGLSRDIYPNFEGKLQFVNGIFVGTDANSGSATGSAFGVSMIFGNGISVPTTGIIGYTEVPFDININSVKVVCKETGALNFYIRRIPFDAYGATPTTIKSSSFTSVNKYSQNNLNILAYQNDILIFGISTIATITLATISITGIRV